MKKNKPLIISIIVLAIIAIALGVVLAISKINKDNNEVKHLSKENLANSITLTVKDEYTKAIELTKNSNFIDPLDMVTVTVSGQTIDTKTANEKVSIICDTSLIDSSKNASYTVKYTVNAFDDYDQEVTKEFSQIYTVKDTQKPEITIIEAEVTINNAQSYDPASNVTVSDNYDTIAKVNALSNGLAGFVVEGEWSNTKAGTYTLTVKAKDSDDNYADEKTFNLIVKESSSNPSNNDTDDDTFNTMNSETYKVSQAIDQSIKIRSGAGTNYSQVSYDSLSASTQKEVTKGSDGYAYLQGNDTFTVFKTKDDENGNTWGRIDPEINAWVCIQYGDEIWASIE